MIVPPSCRLTYDDAPGRNKSIGAGPATATGARAGVARFADDEDALSIAHANWPDGWPGVVGEESATDYNSRADLDSLVRPGVDLQLPPVSAEMSARMNEVCLFPTP